MMLMSVGEDEGEGEVGRKEGREKTGMV